MIHLANISRRGRRIDWSLVDPLLREDGGDRFTARQWVARLAFTLGIARSTLAQRRRRLGLAPLPRGRPTETQLTQQEAQVMAKHKEGKVISQIAQELGMSPQNVRTVLERAKAKLPVACDECGGEGVVHCSTCRGPNGYPRGGHVHTCLKCGGKSTTWATAGIRP